MSKFTALTPQLYDYMCAHRSERDPVLGELVEETRRLGPVALMQVAPEQGALLTMLARITQAKNALEIGTFTGYSAISIARGLAPGGRLLCCDVSTEWTEIASRYFARAGLSDRIELRIAPAIETLRALPREEWLDLVFIDADKTGYRSYFDEVLPRLRPNGLLLFDNVLWNGRVVDASDDREATRAIREMNDHLAQDPRVETVMLAVADGLTLVRKRTPEERA